MRDYSQNKESLVLKSIFDIIGAESNFAVEFGAGNGYDLSNIRYFLEQGWSGLQIEGIVSADSNVKQEFITKENINDLFKKYKVPTNVDLVSIDIDGNDYWVWKELNYEPNVVLIEYNSNFAVGEKYALKYDANHIFEGYYSASISAFIDLAIQKGYYLCREVNFCNLIFVKNKFKEVIPELDPYTIGLPKKHHAGIEVSKFTQV
jgi:hypothetical protein